MAGFTHEEAEEIADKVIAEAEQRKRFATNKHGYLIIAEGCDSVVVGAVNAKEAINAWCDWFIEEDGEDDDPSSLIESVTRVSDSVA